MGNDPNKPSDNLSDDSDESGIGSTDEATEDNDDVTEDDSTSDDSSDDTTESDDSDGNEDEGDSEDTETDISQQYFDDPASVPKELRGAFKRMQGNYTRKMQQASQVVKEAAHFRQIVNDPRFIEWANSLGKSPNRPSKQVADDTSEEGDDTPLTAKSLQSMLAKQEERFNQRLQEQNNAAKAERQARLIRREFKQFRGAHPDWKNYEVRMKDVMEDNPKLTFEDAYYLVKRPDASRSQRVNNIKSKINANSSRKPTGSEGKDTEGKPKIKSIGDAAKLAIKQLEKKGIRFS